LKESRKKSRVQHWTQRPFLKRIDGDVPIAHWFKNNPLGTLIGLFLFYVTVNLWTTNLPTNPFRNDAQWITLWQGFYNNTNWFLTLALPFFMFSVVLEMIESGSGHTEHLTGFGGTLSRAQAHFFAARIGQKSSPVVPKIGEASMLNQKIAGKKE